MMYSKVITKAGKTIEVLSREVEGLRKKGFLKPGSKEEKVSAVTKEEKKTGGTKSGVITKANWKDNTK